MNLENSLLIPVELTAFAHNSTGKNETFRRWEMDPRGRLEEYLSAEPGVFQLSQANFNKPSELGVYLHWTFPKAMRKGQVDPDAQVKWDNLPNRWLIVRLAGAVNDRKTKAWILYSDDKSFRGTGSPFLAPDVKDLSKAITYIGESFPLESKHWNEEDKVKDRWWLNTLGMGDINFLSYQPHVKNVFSFHDDLKDIDGNEVDKSISYLVTGWYSDTTKDIVQGLETDEKLRAFLTARDWELPDNQPLNGIKRSVYHGLVHTLVNSSTVKPAPTSITNMQLGVGNTPTDALTSLLKRKATKNKNKDGSKNEQMKVQLLRAFQYGLLPSLDDPNGEERVFNSIRKNWFIPKEGGISWAISDEDTPENQQRQISTEQTAKEKTWLAQLNNDQEEFNRKQLLLEDQQRELYIAWWKKERLPFDRSVKDDEVLKNKLKDQMEVLPGEVKNLHAELLELSKQLPLPIQPNEKENMEEQVKAFAEAKGIAPTRKLKAETKTPFWMTNDPVVIITGINPKKQSVSGSKLKCRNANQVVSEFSFAGRSITGEELGNAGIFPDLGTDNTPGLIKQLLTEWLLLDPGNSTRIAKKILQDPEQQVALQEAMAEHNPETYSGVLPLLNLKSWKQPWKPVFLEWMVKWYPIPSVNAQGKACWTFNGREYEFEGCVESQVNFMIRGRTFLTPQNSELLKDRLNLRLSQYPKDEQPQNLKDFIEKIDDWDFLTQALTGFNLQLLQLSDMLQRVPEGENIALVGQQTNAFPDLANRSGTFRETRQGQFYFTQLYVYDTFGQTRVLVHPEGKYSSLQRDTLFMPARDDNYTPKNYIVKSEEPPPHPYRWVQLPPRLLQYSRLNLDWLDYLDDNKLVASDPNAHPVCAWVIPNHLDEGLSFFDRKGEYLGIADKRVNTDGKPIIQWNPSPWGAFDRDNQGYPVKEKYPHLHDLLKALCQEGAEAVENFKSFMETIDTTQWTTDALVGSEEQFQSVLMGHPMALVRVQLHFELAGKPVTDPNWKPAKLPLPKLIDQWFDIRLGSQGGRQDGLIGYFTGNKYNRFFAVHDPSGGESDFIEKIRPGKYMRLNFNRNDMDNKAILTMLVDPRAQVYAETGLLPMSSIALPEQFTEEALCKMELVFRYGPLLTQEIMLKEEGNDKSQPAITMPLPAELQGQWRWQQKQQEEGWPEWQVVAPQTVAEHLKGKTAQATEGYLRLKRPEKPKALSSFID